MNNKSFSAAYEASADSFTYLGMTSLSFQFYQYPKSTTKEINMKKTIRIIAITLLFAASASTPVLASGPVPVPLCYPDPCLVN